MSDDFPAGSGSAGPRLSKEERENLLTQLEASAGHSESPDRQLARARECLAQGNHGQAQRLLKNLEVNAPYLQGLELLRKQLMSAEQDAKRQANLKRAEDMLTQAIQERKKTLAQMALDTLREIAPSHPQLAEYEIWIRDLDQEVALQQRVDSLVTTGREALQSGDVDKAREQLEALRSLDPWSQATDDLAEEIEEAERGAEARSGIFNLKHLIQDALDARDAGAAQMALEKLGAMDVPKITLDTYAKRIQDLRQTLQDESEASSLEKRFAQALDAGRYSQAREVARELGRRFPDDPHSTELFNRVAEVEAGERRKASIQQGILQVERFIAAGDRGQAEMALRVVRGMGPDAVSIAQLEAKIRMM
ncbi:MAG: hypothetical protein MPN21_02125 [Thermoanaerobaculia bacterium]|nr:hypothetical protein [Thermoanaerobaculia bacterium]